MANVDGSAGPANGQASARHWDRVRIAEAPDGSLAEDAMLAGLAGLGRVEAPNDVRAAGRVDRDARVRAKRARVAARLVLSSAIVAIRPVVIRAGARDSAATAGRRAPLARIAARAAFLVRRVNAQGPVVHWEGGGSLIPNGLAVPVDSKIVRPVRLARNA